MVGDVLGAIGVMYLFYVLFKYGLVRLGPIRYQSMLVLPAAPLIFSPRVVVGLLLLAVLRGGDRPC